MHRARLVVLCLVLASACGGGSDAAAPDNRPPTAAFTGGCAGLTCAFTESSQDPDGHIAAWSWDFGDQSSASTDQHPAHTYGSVGSFQVTLTVTDDDGDTDSETKTITTTVAVVTPLSVTLDQQAGFKVALTGSATCEAHANTFRITAPVVSVLTTDGCYDPEAIGKEVVYPGPYPAGTVINAEFTSAKLSGPPRVRITGSYPTWTIGFEDGPDDDFDDMTVTITALP